MSIVAMKKTSHYQQDHRTYSSCVVHCPLQGALNWFMKCSKYFFYYPQKIFSTLMFWVFINSPSTFFFSQHILVECNNRWIERELVFNVIFRFHMWQRFFSLYWFFLYTVHSTAWNGYHGVCEIGCSSLLKPLFKTVFASHILLCFKESFVWFCFLCGVMLAEKHSLEHCFLNVVWLGL